jgi:hypothetical protein
MGFGEHLNPLIFLFFILTTLPERRFLSLASGGSQRSHLHQENGWGLV